jgi:hypothetical protein
MLARSSGFRSIVVGSRNVFSKLLRAFNPIQTEWSSLVVDPEPTDCHSPSPRDWPLGPGRAGRPLSYLDKQTDTLLYLEGGGRHLAALSSSGKILWLKNPIHEDLIARRWKRKGHFVAIQFDSSQFGVVDIKNGDFLFNGQT